MFRHRNLIPSVLVATILLCSITVALAQDELSENKQAPTAEKDFQQVQLTSSNSPSVTLGDLRDIGLSIILIRQLAKNIYMEVTRKPVPSSASPHIEDLKLITSGNIEAESEYEPVRPEWVVYYVGTMEPILHLFRADIESTKSGAKKLLVPKGTAAKFQKMLDEYDGYVKEMKENVSQIYENCGDSTRNIAIAQEAVKLYDVTEKLELIRKKAFNLIKNAKRDGLEDATPKNR